MSATDVQLERLRDAVDPAVSALGLDVYDLELLGGRDARTLRLTVTRDGGVDLEAITEVTRVVSPIVDETTDIAGSFLLEVSSPGIERDLRRPEHFTGAVGEPVSIKFLNDAGPQRVRGVLRDFDGTRCVVESETGDRDEIAFDQITQARTIFEWGPQPRPGKGKAQDGKAGRARAKGKAKA